MKIGILISALYKFYYYYYYYYYYYFYYYHHHPANLNHVLDTFCSSIPLNCKFSKAGVFLVFCFLEIPRNTMNTCSNPGVSLEVGNW